MPKMIKTPCGYMTATEWMMICRIAKQEEREAKVKATKQTKKT